MTRFQSFFILIAVQPYFAALSWRFWVKVPTLAAALQKALGFLGGVCTQP